MMKYILLLLLLPIHNLLADEIFLNNGDNISGIFVELSLTTCTFKTPYQATLYIERDLIKHLLISDPVVIKFNSGDHLTGTVTTLKDQMFFESAILGQLKIKLTDVDTMVTTDDTGNTQTMSAIRGRGVNNNIEVNNDKPSKSQEAKDDVIISEKKNYPKSKMLRMI
ncbi:MAG: hypothetical protein IMF12_08285 [Proteobacteria bacterium]|nr:hypothetical protein [Pseudomonadota bacterium]